MTLDIFAMLGRYLPTSNRFGLEMLKVVGHVLTDGAVSVIGLSILLRGDDTRLEVFSPSDDVCEHLPGSLLVPASGRLDPLDAIGVAVSGEVGRAPADNLGLALPAGSDLIVLSPAPAVEPHNHLPATPSDYLRMLG